MWTFKKYGFVWITVGFFLVSLGGHWLFGWFAYSDQQVALNAQATLHGYAVGMLRDTFENWQSDFLQLLWQIAGLSALLYIGSPQSRDSDSRREAKLDAILRKLDPQEAEATINSLKQKYPHQ